MQGIARFVNVFKCSNRVIPLIDASTDELGYSLGLLGGF